MELDEIGLLIEEIGVYADRLDLHLGIDYTHGYVYLFAACNPSFHVWYVAARSWQDALDRLHYDLLIYGPELDDED